MTKASAMPKPSPWLTTARTDVQTNIARIFNTYGPRMQLKDGRVVPAFIDQVLNGEALTDFRRRFANTKFLLRFRPRARPGSALPVG